MSQIRQRYPTSEQYQYEPTTSSSTSMPPSAFSKPAHPGKALAASTLLQSSPTHYGQVKKLDVPLLYTLAPTWLQRLLRYCPSPFRPTWKKRYMIQIGKYIYRYQIGKSGNTAKMKIKGMPIALETVDIRPLLRTTFGLREGAQTNQDIIALAHDIPSNCDGFFSITSSGQTRYYAVSNEEESRTWINSVRDGRQACIEQRMGHDKRPYPDSWRYIDSMGEERVRRCGRIKESIQRAEKREMEMVGFMEGSMSRMGQFS